MPYVSGFDRNQLMCCSWDAFDIVNITLHFFLKDVRPMLPLVMKHNTVVA